MLFVKGSIFLLENLMVEAWIHSFSWSPCDAFQIKCLQFQNPSRICTLLSLISTVLEVQFLLFFRSYFPHISTLIDSVQIYIKINKNEEKVSQVLSSSTSSTFWDCWFSFPINKCFQGLVPANDEWILLMLCCFSWCWWE